MICNPILLAGIQVPCDAPFFLVVLAIHIPAGVLCVGAGLGAMLSPKRAGRHVTFGVIYYWGLAAVCVSAGALAALRWAEDYPFFILGVAAFAAASLGRTARRHHWPGWVRLHIAGLGLSYILMLTAFYVDNGPNLPVWQALPPLAFWLLPGAIGLPILFRAMLWHPLAAHHRKRPA